MQEQLTAKYGKEFAQTCMSNTLNNVNEKLMHKLAIQAPPKILVEKYLEEIAKTYSVPFEPDPQVMLDDENYNAEELLIDFGGQRKSNGGGRGGGGGGGGGGGMTAPSPQQQPQPGPYQVN